jgi:hypothetical protein
LIPARAAAGSRAASRGWAAAATAVLAAWLLLGGGVGGVARATSVGQSADPGGPLPIDSLIAAPAPAPLGQTLSRALSADGSTRNNNLDLLLELHGSAPAGGGASASAVVPSSAGSIKVSPMATLPAELAKRAPLSPTRSTLLTRDGGLPLPAADWARPSRDWGAEGRSGDGFSSGIGEPAGPGGSRGEPFSSAVEDGLVRELLSPVTQFVRVYREWMLGVLVLLFLIGAVFKVFSRRF